MRGTSDAPIAWLSISAAIHHYSWRDHTVNLIDTPGYSNFLSETRAALRVSGGTVVMLSAISGVKVQTEVVWGYADDYEVSRVAFVNKMDRERANFLRAVDDLEKVLGVKAVAVQLPVTEGPGFNSVVDLITMKLHRYPDGGHGKKVIEDLPADHDGDRDSDLKNLRERAEAAREIMVEAIVETDDALTEKYLDGGEITEAELIRGLREGVITKRFVPVLCGSALTGTGVDLLMDTIIDSLPSPLDRGPTRGFKKGTDPDSGEEVTREPGEDEPFSALGFKSHIDPYTGKLSYLRIYSGKVTSGSHVVNTTRGGEEKLSHLFLIEGEKTKEVAEAAAGDIVAVPKLKDTHAGDTLSDRESQVTFTANPTVKATLSYAIAAKTKADEDKVPQAIAKLTEEDPSLDFHRDNETKEFILAGVGQVHLEVSVEKLKRKYGCEVALTTPLIPYKETIRSMASVQGKYKKQSGGRGQYGDTWIEISPLKSGSGFVFENAITGGVVPRQYIPAVEKGIKEAMSKGVLAGYPVVDVKVRLYDGSHHSVDSSEMAFKIAASMGFKKAMEAARPVLLEPVAAMEILIPDEHMGDVIGDINSRRGKVQGVEPKRGGQLVRASVPMGEVIDYSTHLKGLTGDRGVFTMEFSHYEEVPTHLSRKLIEKAKGPKER